MNPTPTFTFASNSLSLVNTYKNFNWVLLPGNLQRNIANKRLVQTKADKDSAVMPSLRLTSFPQEVSKQRLHNRNSQSSQQSAPTNQIRICRLLRDKSLKNFHDPAKISATMHFLISLFVKVLVTQAPMLRS